MEADAKRQQRVAFKAELARLGDKKAAGTLTPAEAEAPRQATAVRQQRLSDAATARQIEAQRVAKAVRAGRDPHATRADLPSRKQQVVRGRAAPPRITRVVGGGSPGLGRRA